MESGVPMVVLNSIYTKTGDKGETALVTGVRVPKDDLRIACYGTVDETNSAIGIARTATSGLLDQMLGRIQNDLFDLGADLATPETGKKLEYEPLRIVQAQVDRLEREIDLLNADLEPLRSFVLPGGNYHVYDYVLFWSALRQDFARRVAAWQTAR